MTEESNPKIFHNKTTKVATTILLDHAKNGFKNGNFVCSPFSIEIVLGMLAFGAQGQTLKQLLEFLGHESLDELRSMSSVSTMLDQILLSTVKGRPDVRIVNEVWVAEHLKPVQSCYQEALETVYKTKPEYIDIKNKSDQSGEIINSWAKEKTNGLIPKLINEMSPDDVLVIANSLYFKGIWSKPFDLECTKEKDFHLINGEKVSVPFMTSFKKFDYGSFGSYKIIKLPYESGFKGLINKFKLPYKTNGQWNEFSMYICLPDSVDGLQDLLQLGHSYHSLFYRDFNLHERELDELWIPKFEISCTINVHDVMQQMGLTLPFDKTNKELSGIVEQKHLNEGNLYVSKILQRSVIKVDEKGTEAAAATFMFSDILGCPQRPPPERFVADHPFMFMIRENTSGTVFFSGVVVNPGIKS